MRFLLGILAALPACLHPAWASTPQALNPYNQNTIDNDTITLYYNGTGPVPGYNLKSPIPKPITPLTNPSVIAQYFYTELGGIINGSAISDKCTKCIASVELMHLAAITQPVSTVTNLLIQLCEAIPAFQDTIYAQTCFEEFSGKGDLGPYMAQLFSKMSVATGDMQAWCWFYYACDLPPAVDIEESLYFDPKPDSANTGPAPSGM